MQRSDWIGLAASVGLHGLLILAFSLMSAMSPQQQPIGMAEVEFGEFAEGRPVEATLEPIEPAEPEPEDPQPEEEPEPEPEPTVEEETEPVDLPEEEITDPETIPEPEEETETPEPQEEQLEGELREREEETEQTGEAEEGSPGEGADDERTAPYDIEGLDRNPVNAPAPEYLTQAEGTIRVRITVDPNGRIVGRMPLTTGHPSLERAALEVLQRWRFNALPPTAPQENQTGIVTFRFQLE